MKNNIKIISYKVAQKWILPANVFANSLISVENALLQFNRLKAKERLDIIKEMQEYDELRQKAINKDGESKEDWIICSMVDSHIMATKFDIDPLVVFMCIKAPCGINEMVVIK
ncbi:MAG TPA: hypothetical protein IAC41_08370 [Candidatus Merdenecus merdavium]|nr:hypothetical protein [Candidatus Merdenecus merdavium]